MSRFSPRLVIIATGTLALLLALAHVAAAQGNPPVRNIHRLGGSTAFYKPPLRTVADLKRMGTTARTVADIRTVMGQAGVPELADDVVRTMASANTSVRGGLCSDATPADGTIVECDVQRGQTMQWMAYRPRGGTSLGLLRNIRWDGPRPFQAYLFRITRDNRIYTFIVPKICGNLTLMGVQDIPRMTMAAPVPPPAAEPPAVAVAAPPPPPPPPPPEVAAVAPAAPQAAAPPPPPAPSVRGLPFFFDVLGGKDRRTRPIEGRTTGNGRPVVANAGELNDEFSQCSPLIGLKIGMAKRFQNDWELAGGPGIAISLVHADDKVKQHELFADVEVNKYLGNGFVGTGLSLWDLTRSDSFTPAWIIHAGLPIAPNAKVPVHFVVEGRVPLDHADDIGNNYVLWGGFRFRF